MPLHFELPNSQFQQEIFLFREQSSEADLLPSTDQDTKPTFIYLNVVYQPPCDLVYHFSSSKFFTLKAARPFVVDCPNGEPVRQPLETVILSIEGYHL
jgi:hypothetical protein